MATTYQVQFPTVSTSATVSGAFGLSAHRMVALWAPTVDSCELRLKGSYDQTSANFLRMDDTNIDPGASGYTNEFLWQVGAGSKGLLMSRNFDGTPFAKVELSVAQTSPRTLAVILAFD